MSLGPGDRVIDSDGDRGTILRLRAPDADRPYAYVKYDDRKAAGGGLHFRTAWRRLDNLRPDPLEDPPSPHPDAPRKMWLCVAEHRWALTKINRCGVAEGHVNCGWAAVKRIDTRKGVGA